MLKTPPVRLTAPLALALAATAAHAADATIAGVAPEDSFILLHVPSLAEARALWQDSRLRAFATSEPIAAWLTSLRRHEAPDLDAVIEAWEEALEEIGHPTGAAGVASYLGPDPEGGWTTHDMALVDWGENAEAAEDRLLDWLEEQEDEGALRLEDERFGEATIWIVSPPENADEERPDWNTGGPLDALTDTFADRLNLPWTDDRRAFITRFGTVLLAGTERAAVERAIEALEGRDRAVAADAEAVRDALAWAPADGMAHLIVNTGPLLRVGGEGVPGFIETRATRAQLEAAGLTEVRWIGASTLLDERGELATIVAHVRVPEKRGAVALLDVPGRAFEGSPLASADSASVGWFRFNFAGVLPLAREIIATLPPADRQQGEAALAQAAGFVEPLLNAVGPDIHYVVDIARPFTARSQAQVVALAVKDRQIVSNTLTFGAGLVNAAPETFLGAQVFTADGVPLAVGLTDAWLIFGADGAVRDAIRRAAEPGAGLADEPQFRRAIAQLPPRPTMVGLENLTRSVPFTLWSIESWEQNARAMFEAIELGEGGPGADDFVDAIREQREAIAKDAPQPEAILRHTDAALSWLEPTRDGFDGRWTWLAPE